MPQLDFAMYSTMTFVFSFYFVGFFIFITYLFHRYMVFCQIFLLFLRHCLRTGYSATFLFLQTHMTDGIWWGYCRGILFFNNLVSLF